MSEPGLDLTAYEAAVTEHVLFGLARSRELEERFDGVAWRVDLTRAELTLEDAGTFPVQLLGTWSHESDTFLWSWANPNSGEWKPSVVAAEALRARGHGEPGFAAFTERKIAPAWVHPMELALVAGELSGGLPVLARTSDTGATALFLVGGTDLESFEPNPIKLRGLVDDLEAFVMAPVRPIVERFLARLRFSVLTIGADTRAKRDGRMIRLHWSEDERLTSLSGEFGP
jgi:hypothetical protein